MKQFKFNRNKIDLILKNSVIKDLKGQGIDLDIKDLVSLENKIRSIIPIKNYELLDKIIQRCGEKEFDWTKIQDIENKPQWFIEKYSKYLNSKT
jgi:hypothetical protein